MFLSVPQISSMSIISPQPHWSSMMDTDQTLVHGSRQSWCWCHTHTKAWKDITHIIALSRDIKMVLKLVQKCLMKAGKGDWPRTFTVVRGWCHRQKCLRIWACYEDQGEGNGIPLQCSYLESPMDGGAW